MPFEQGVDAVIFIRTYSEQNALVLPGRLSKYRLNTDLHILPCSMNKSYVYGKYIEASRILNKVPVSLASWYEIWKQFCLNVVIEKPKIDLCATFDYKTVPFLWEKCRHLVKKKND
jgi:hypothetical protein